MADFGAYTFYIVGAYSVSALGLGGLIVFCVCEARRSRKKLQQENAAL